MSFSFSNHTIENLKNQINIVDVIGRCVPLKRAGNNYKGVCPFHNEKTPSFVVSEQKQIFTCFGCGATGDVIEFVKRFYNLEFSEAVEKLANEYGITLEKKAKDDNRDVYYQVNRMAANFFYKAFTETANKGYPYMKNRGISPAILKKFGIGYADEKWDSLYQYLLSQGVDTKIMVELGLVSESKGKYYDKFRNRVMFPIINTSGKVIGFGGRAIHPDDNPKYLNSPESKIFQKKNNLYGLNISRQSVGKDGYIILVEGYMDVIALYQAGVTNVAASLGTALTENQARLIKRYTKNVVLSYDADGAGRAAALRGLDILKAEECKVRVLHVTDGKDPDEYIKAFGKDAFARLLDQSENQVDYRLDQIRKKFNLEDDVQRVSFLQEAAQLIASLNSPVEREIYGGHAAQTAGISAEAMAQEVKKAFNARVRKQDKQRERRDLSPATKLQPDARSLRYDNIRSARAEEGVIRLLFLDAGLAQCMDGLTSREFSSPLLGKVYDQILMRLEQGSTPQLPSMAEALTGEEMDHMARVIDQPESVANSRRSVADYIAIIRGEAMHRSDLAGDDLLLAAQKKYQQKKAYMEEAE